MDRRQFGLACAGGVAGVMVGVASAGGTKIGTLTNSLPVSTKKLREGLGRNKKKTYRVEISLEKYDAHSNKTTNIGKGIVGRGTIEAESKGAVIRHLERTIPAVAVNYNDGWLIGDINVSITAGGHEMVVINRIRLQLIDA